ncbi:helix-turn-helix transcriptional regulator [Anaerococcus rubeinfantis]|uniref:helix-turn-helix transcriptional regulator n=1 Tax=Anaerococcus rubeinfantis TaxID=1720199 RepID=UPI00073F357F|nr:helix-turn-helix transcriptional regulator [Anaerococcus rubeinfantis]
MVVIEKVNKKLREERLNKNYTYEDMSKLLGYKSKSTYMYIERGITMPKLDTMNAIADIFHKPVQYFFDLKVQEYGINQRKKNDKSKIDEL